MIQFTLPRVRDGKFDVVVAAGPHVEVWPSPGVRALAVTCAEMGLSVGVFGGESLSVRGAVPRPGTGGMVLVEDVQKRLHRIHGRAIVKVVSPLAFPDPFPGWRSPVLVPLSTARRIRRESRVPMGTASEVVAILGSGNKALRFGSSLLESGVSEVMCIEINAHWGAKRIAAWEVERRRFEIAGGKLIEARPVSLSRKDSGLWEFRVQDSQGVRVLEVSQVVSAGPFGELPGVREYPAGSLLFELDQTSEETRSEDVEGWVMEEERGRFLGGKIARILEKPEAGLSDAEKTDALDRSFRRARGRLKRYLKHLDEPFVPGYQGKWIAAMSAREMRAFSGVPRGEHRKRLIASIECFEEIPCDVCQTACPENAIRIGRVPRGPEPVLDESRCSGCGLCVSACPSSAIVQIREKENESFSELELPWRGANEWKEGNLLTLLNRRGESLGSGRVTAFEAAPPQPGQAARVRLAVPTHLLWESRGVRKPKVSASEDVGFLEAQARTAALAEKIELTLNGEKRLVSEGIPITLALFENGLNRSEDALYCRDGSCGLCQVQVDGVKQLSCQTRTRKGMAIRTPEMSPLQPAAQDLCSCQGISTSVVIERIRQAHLQSPEAVISVTHVGEGKCHGQFCMGAFKRLLQEQGIEVSQWIDWRFPWTEWVL